MFSRHPWNMKVRLYFKLKENTSLKPNIFALDSISDLRELDLETVGIAHKMAFIVSGLYKDS